MLLPDPRMEAPSLMYPGRKPASNVAVNWSHPLLRNVRYFVYADFANEQVSGTPVQPFFNINEKMVANDNGTGFYCGSGAKWTFSVSPMLDVVTNRSFSMVAVTSIIGTPTPIANIVGNAAANFGLHNGVSAGTQAQLRYTHANQSATIDTADFTIADGEYVIAIGRSNVLSADNNYCNAVNFPNTPAVSPAVGTAGGLSVPTTLEIGGDTRQETSRYIPQIMHMSFGCQTYWTNDEVASLQKDPYQVLVPA